MSTNNTATVDPITVEIIRNGLLAVTEEMKTNLMRTAYNLIIYEALDFTVGLFTPKGEIKNLSAGSTPLDFAYAVHTDVGNHTVAARVDRRLVPIRTKLLSGQTVEIITAPSANPSPNWLEFVVTSKARTAIRHYLKHLQHEDAGRDGTPRVDWLQRVAAEPAQHVGAAAALRELVGVGAEPAVGAIAADDHVVVGASGRAGRAVDEALRHETLVGRGVHA